ncbi:MAG: hypothetical protein ACM3Q1_10555, partial [Bacteroidales bacterium]
IAGACFHAPLNAPMSQKTVTVSGHRRQKSRILAGFKAATQTPRGLVAFRILTTSDRKML